MLDNDDMLARAASTSSAGNVWGITGEECKSFTRRSMCDADTSRSFSSICVLVYATERMTRIRATTHDKSGTTLTFDFFSSSNARVAIYVVHLASNCTRIIILDHAAQRRGRPLDDSRRARRKKSREDNLENVECVIGRCRCCW